MKYLTLLFLFTPLLIFGQKYTKQSIKLFNEGVAEYKKGNADNALSLFTDCVNADPSYAEAYLNISVIQYNKKDYEKALHSSLKAYQYKKNEASILSQVGKSYYHSNQFDSSAYFLNESTEKGMNNEVVYFMLADSYYQTKDYSKAKSNVDKAIAKNSNSFDYYLLRGNINFDLGDKENAIKDYEKAYSIDSKQNIIYANMANVYIYLNENEKALEFINKGINQAQGSEKVTFLILMGNYYFNLQDLDNAQKYYDEAFELDAENPIILTNQASVFLEKNEFQSAWDKCTEALEIDQSFMEAYYNRGIANEMLRNVEEACSDWEEAFILGSSKAEEFLNSPVCNE